MTDIDEAAASFYPLELLADIDIIIMFLSFSAFAASLRRSGVVSFSTFCLVAGRHYNQNADMRSMSAGRWSTSLCAEMLGEPLCRSQDSDVST